MTRLPVLTFHAITDAPTPVAFGRAAFAAMMRRLADGGWRTVGGADVIAFAKGTKAIPPRSFAVTFDDGYASVLHAAAPVLREHGFGALLFLATSLLDRPTIFPGDALCPVEPALTWDDARALAQQGFEIGSHAMAHAKLPALDDRELDAELAGSREILERRIGAPVRLHAYPFGACDDRVAAVAMRVYDGAFTTRLAHVRPNDPPGLLPRLDAHYLRFLATHGELDSASTRALLAVRAAGRAARALVQRGG